MRQAITTAAGSPYPEQAERKEGRLDRALLHTWGCVAAHWLSAPERKRLGRLVQRAEDEERRIVVLTDQELREAADEVRARSLLVRTNADQVASAFAIAREAARRHRGLRHFQVQLLGGAVMMSGALAEMQTGEGKSLTALLPAITAALMGRPVHIITVNDYLARRDAEEFGPVYNALGLSVGLVQQGQAPQDRRRAYMCDITYCTNKELVFDYLRDRLALGDRRSRSRFLLDQIVRTSSFGPIPASTTARAAFCDRRRSRQRAHRRGAHAAHPVWAAGRSRMRGRAVCRGPRNRKASG